MMGECNLTFQKKPDDVEYRIIGLCSSVEGKYSEFGNQEQIQISQDNVLEIKRSDGSEYIWTGRTQNTFRAVSAGQLLKIPKDIPLQRLWVVSATAPNLWYKIPQQLPVDGAYHTMIIPDGANSVRLCGDKYFCAAYEFL